MGIIRCIQKVLKKDIEMFAQVSTEHKLVQLDVVYAKDTIFERSIAHGTLTANSISTTIGEQLPGHGTVYMGQTLKFLSQVRPGDMVQAEVTVTDLDIAKLRVKVECACSVLDKKSWWVRRQHSHCRESLTDQSQACTRS